MDCTTASGMGTTSRGMCAGPSRGDTCARDMSLRLSTCFPASRVVTALSCGQARFSACDPKRKGNPYAIPGIQLATQFLQAT